MYVPTEEQLADGMTKALPYPTFLAICLNNCLYYYEFFPTGLKESAKWSLAFRVLFSEPLFLSLYIICSGYIFCLFQIQSVLCVYVLCYDAVNPHKYTRIEGETWKYGNFNSW